MVYRLHTVNISIRCLCVACLLFFTSNSMAGFSHYDSGLVNYAQANYKAALEDFYAAAAKNEPGAAHMLMRMHGQGRGTDVDKNKAFRWTLVAAQEGMSDAQFRAAKIYLKRIGAANSHKQALHWFNKAVDQGHIGAHLGLADMYQNGLGVATNTQKARQLYQYAASELDVFAQQGDANSQIQLATLYETGLGVPVNIALALKWIKRAAVTGNAEAQFNLARVLASVDEEDLHPEQALYWVNRASNQGHKPALRLRDELENRWPEFARR